MVTPLRALIIEDSEDDALLVLRELRGGGYDPMYELVDTPTAMKAALDQKTWDVILSDYSMPHFSGLDALELLKKSGLDIPFILISGKVGEEIAVEAMKKGAHDYMMKDKLMRLVPAINRELHEVGVRREHKRAEEKLQENIKELEKWQRLTIGRENRMIELKNEINELKKRLEKYGETF